MIVDINMCGFRYELLCEGLLATNSLCMRFDKIYNMRTYQDWVNDVMLQYPATSPGPWFDIKISTYQYRKSHCGDKTVVRSSYLHHWISYTGKMSSLYWTGALTTCHVAALKPRLNGFCSWYLWLTEKVPVTSYQFCMNVIHRIRW